MGNSVVAFGPAAIRTDLFGATPTALVPVQGRGLAPELQVDEHDLAPALQLRDYSADDAPRPLGDRRDVQLDSFVTCEQPQHGDLGVRLSARASSSGQSQVGWESCA